MKSLTKKTRTNPQGLLDFVLTVLATLVVLAYPFIVYFGLHYYPPWVIYSTVGVLLALRGLLALKYLTYERLLRILVPVMAVVLLFSLGIYFNDRVSLLLLPGLMSLFAGLVFGWTLFTKQSFIETVARSIEEDLSREMARYCDRVTMSWAGFMLLNAGVIFSLAVGGFITAWTIYTGLISYLLIGLLMGSEYVYRQWRFRSYDQSFLGCLFKQIFPPRGNVTPDFVPVRRLMILGREGSRAVSREGRSRFEWNQFETAVRKLRTRLGKSNRRSDEWLVACEESYGFLVGLMAVWHAGCVAVLPPNYQPGSLRDREDEVAGVITDQVLEDFAGPVVHPLEVDEEEGDMRVLEPDDVVAKLFTSGTTGEKRSVTKRMAQFEEEIRTLEKTWRSRLEGCEVCSTVSHQHIYGLLFRILWPLATNRCFDRTTRLFPEDLREQVEGTEQIALVTSPAHLSRLVEYDSLDWLREKLEVVFTSGGRLGYSTAQKCKERLGCLPYEVLGSTETGGIAYRQQETEDAPWKPFDPVSIRTTDRGTLEVRSPFVSADNQQWQDTGDYVEVKQDGTFLLGDRADRVVNVAEKRVSLPEVEDRLVDHELVDTAAATVLESGDGTNRRKEVAAVVTLVDSYTGGDERDLRQRLRSHLKPHFEPVTLPRRWQFVNELPRDPQGKVTHETIRSLFDGVPDESSA